MPADSRPRWLNLAALTVALVLLAACTQNPNSVFHHRTEFNRDVSSLFKLLIVLGTIVFVFTEIMLLTAIIRFRSKPGQPRQPEQTHGNTKLEILWTAIPAVVLAVIAVPTVQTIFKTQAAARSDALEVEVVGHQWWWEFKYPQYNITTANEVYLPLGRMVNFTLNTHDVIHSFWIPGLGGKRDLVYNEGSKWLAHRHNTLWFTPDSTTEEAFNGFCAEYCGTSHANMRFRAFTVTPEQFASWVAHQQQPGASPAPVTPPPTATKTARNQPAAAPVSAPVQAGFVGFDRAKMPAWAWPQTPIPSDLKVDTTIAGDAARGATTVASGTCLGCHTVAGVPTMIGTTGPNLTHVGSRLTIAGGLFPNDKQHLTAWIKNSRAMKPGVFMPTQGKGQYDPVLKATLNFGYTDQQIADIVAYLQTLK